MKIKHWQGYGSVEAKKISFKTENGIAKMHIKVKGNHEWGIHRDDPYDIANWLIKKLDKTFKDYRTITSLHLEDGFENGIETCDYFIEYRI